jgi:two-component system, chemotaxis family, response regulator Rcp1
MVTRPCHILLVENNPNDTVQIMRAIGDELCENLQAVEDGLEALAYMRRQGAYTLAFRPDVVLLDFKLPKKDGWQVLAEMRAEPALKTIPVVMLTPANAEGDQSGGNADAYISKSLKREEFTDVLRTTLNRLLRAADQSSQDSADLPA